MVWKEVFLVEITLLLTSVTLPFYFCSNASLQDVITSVYSSAVFSPTVSEGTETPISFVLIQVLNEYFHNVCELDLVFNFYKVRLFFQNIQGFGFWSF